MTAEQLESRIKQNFPDADVLAMDLTGTKNHWEVRVASEQFKDQSRIKQHQSIMSLFNAELASGEVHALSIKTITK